MGSNEVEVVAILEALHFFVLASFHAPLILESDYLNAVSWVSSSAKGPWRFQFYINEINSLKSFGRVKYQHVLFIA